MLHSNSKVEFFFDLELRNELKLSPANIWIFKFLSLRVFAIKTILDKTNGLMNLLDFKYNHYSSLCQGILILKISKKELDFISQLQID